MGLLDWLARACDACLGGLDPYGACVVAWFTVFSCSCLCTAPRSMVGKLKLGCVVLKPRGVVGLKVEVDGGGCTVRERGMTAAASRCVLFPAVLAISMQ